MQDKFMWHLTENMDEWAIDANKIQLEGVKFKFWNFRGVVCNSTIKKKKKSINQERSWIKGRGDYILLKLTIIPITHHLWNYWNAWSTL